MSSVAQRKRNRKRSNAIALELRNQPAPEPAPKPPVDPAPLQQASAARVNIAGGASAASLRQRISRLRAERAQLEADFMAHPAEYKAALLYANATILAEHYARLCDGTKALAPE